MRALALSLAVSALVAGSTFMFADPVPYPSTGSIASTVTLQATGTSVDAYFAGSSAGDNDFLEIIDLNNGANTGQIFSNNAPPTAVGTEHTLSGVNIGDTIIVDLINKVTGYTFSSDPADSADGVNHAYTTPVTTTSLASLGLSSSLAGGYFVGMEDLYVPGSDLDYNDDTVVLTGVAPTPEPGSFLLLGTGLLGLAGVVRRRALAS